MTAPTSVKQERLTLLVVDDEPEIRDFLKSVFEEEGFIVHTAPHGAAAWALLQHIPVALVLTDFMMTRLTGVELMHRMMAHPQLPQIPVILMSAVVPKYDQNLFALVVEKPFSIWDLIDRVRTIVVS